MLLLPGSILVGATVILIVALAVIAREQEQGKRLFLPRVRDWLDRCCDAVANRMRRLGHIMSISCAYVVHQIRATLARVIAPRPRVRRERQRLQFEKTDNHLSSMHDHKADTALTPAQKKKLRNKKLEERM